MTIKTTTKKVSPMKIKLGRKPKAQPVAPVVETPVVAAAPVASTKKVPPTVTVTLPFVRQSPKYLEIKVDEKPGWLALDSITSHEINGEMVTVEMPRPLARRRGFLAAA